VYYYFSEQIGSSRAIAVRNGGNAGTLCFDADFYPFGGGCAGNGDVLAQNPPPTTITWPPAGTDPITWRAILLGAGQLAIRCWGSTPCMVAVGVVAVGVAAYTVHQARKGDLRQVDEAMRRLSKICGRPLGNDERERLHDAIQRQGYDLDTIIQVGIGMFCPEKGGR